MLYTDLTKKAMNIAYKAHEGVFDKSGWPYICHPIHVAESMETEDTCVVALLHDVIEDTDLTFEDLKNEGITDVQIEALKLLTHDDSVPYLDYVRKIKTNEIAKAVKLSDLAHNSDITRLGDNVREKDLEKLKKYQKAKDILNGICE